MHPYYFKELKLVKIPKKLRVTQIWIDLILFPFDRRHSIGSTRNKTLLPIVQSRPCFVCNF